jgi:putative SOS response-associated peptidase YedK
VARPQRLPEGETLRTFATITTDANRQLSTIQDRMPVIIEPENWPLWLGEAEGDAAALLRPTAEDVLRSGRSTGKLAISETTGRSCSSRARRQRRRFVSLLHYSPLRFSSIAVAIMWGGATFTQKAG